jgi:hypothetical protein
MVHATSENCCIGIEHSPETAASVFPLSYDPCTFLQNASSGPDQPDHDFRRYFNGSSPTCSFPVIEPESSQQSLASPISPTNYLIPQMSPSGSRADFNPREPEIAPFTTPATQTSDHADHPSAVTRAPTTKSSASADSAPEDCLSAFWKWPETPAVDATRSVVLSPADPFADDWAFR